MEISEAKRKIETIIKIADNNDEIHIASLARELQGALEADGVLHADNSPNNNNSGRVSPDHPAARSSNASAITRRATFGIVGDAI